MTAEELKKQRQLQQSKQLQNDFIPSGTHMDDTSHKRRGRQGGKNDSHRDESQFSSSRQSSRAPHRKDSTETWASQSTPDIRDEDISHLFKKKTPKIPYEMPAWLQDKIKEPRQNSPKKSQETDSRSVQLKDPMDNATIDTMISDSDKAPRFVTVKDWTGDRAGGGEASRRNNPVAQNQTSAAVDFVALGRGAGGQVGGGRAGPVRGPEKKDHTSGGHRTTTSISDIHNIVKIKDEGDRVKALREFSEFLAKHG